MWLWQILHDMGGILVEDDIKDFPWNPISDGDPWDGRGGHMPGMPHHGMLGLAMQTLAYLGGMADVGSEIAKDFQEKSELQLIQEQFEPIAYPIPAS